MDMSSPTNRKEIQSLTGRVAAFEHFISKFSNKCNPFFQTLKKKAEWPNECELAFQNIKKYLMTPPVLTSPSPGQTIGMYLASSYIAVSAVWFTEDEGKPIFFISKKLTGS